MKRSNSQRRTRSLSKRVAGSLVACALMSSLFVGMSVDPASAGIVHLWSGGTLYSGWVLDTNTGFELPMQGDGNLVEYQNWSTVKWYSNTYGNPGAFLLMQTDGNLVVFTSGWQWLWKSGTQGWTGAYLALQDDGNLVVYNAQGNSPLWALSWTQQAAGSQTYAAQTMWQYGWGFDQWTYLYQLWNLESGWQWNIGWGGCHYPNCNLNNAYGIPQSFPGTKMGDRTANGGPDWVYDGLTQIQWGMEYIHRQYTTPQAAWNHEWSCGTPPCGY